jgi:hypothetical protein
MELSRLAPVRPFRVETHDLLASRPPPAPTNGRSSLADCTHPVVKKKRVKRGERTAARQSGSQAAPEYGCLTSDERRARHWHPVLRSAAVRPDTLSDRLCERPPDCSRCAIGSRDWALCRCGRGSAARPAGRRQLHTPGRSLEQPHVEHVLDPLDGAGQSRLRRLQERGDGDEAAVVGNCDTASNWRDPRSRMFERSMVIYT